MHTTMHTERHVRLFKNGRNQALRIPRDFELPGDEAILTKEEDRLIVKPVARPSLLAVLATLEPLKEDFPEIQDPPPQRLHCELLVMKGKRYLLDTNILSDLVRNPKGLIARRIEAVGEERVCTSLVVSAELRFGARKKGSERLSLQLETVLSALDILPLEAPVDEHYAGLRLALEHAGTPIGGNDMLIAAQALALGLILVTANEREFSRVPGLSVENWLGIVQD